MLLLNETLETQYAWIRNRSIVRKRLNFCKMSVRCNSDYYTLFDFFILMPPYVITSSYFDLASRDKRIYFIDSFDHSIRSQYDLIKCVGMPSLEKYDVLLMIGIKNLYPKM